MKPLAALFLTAVLAQSACSAAATPTPTAALAPASATTRVTPTVERATATRAPSATATAAPSSTAPPAATVTATTEVGQPPSFDPASYRFEAVASGLSRPVLVTHAGDGTDRLFVIEQGGTIRVIEAGEVLPQPFLDLTGQVSGGSEQGLLGLAFDPAYAENGTFFINYTDLAGDTQVERCQVSAADPNLADEASCATVLTVDQPYPNHNGGQLAFGPDGYLYISLGDGGAAGDPEERAQNLGTLLGKLLRIDVSGGDEAPYSVPPDNPFAGQGDARPEIWAYGLRNPWRFTFDRGTGDLYIGDVGQDGYEEIDFQRADSPGGENYGWDYMEGLQAFEGAAPPGKALVPPVTEYPLTEGRCAVAAGYVYRGPSLPELNGVYFFGDYCSGQVWTLVPSGAGWQTAAFASTGFNISSFGEDEAGELYLCSYAEGVIYRLARKG